MKQEAPSTTSESIWISWNKKHMSKKHRLVLWVIAIFSFLRLNGLYYSDMMDKHYWTHERRYRDHMQKVQKWKATVLDSDLNTHSTNRNTSFEVTDEWLDSCLAHVVASDPPRYYKGKFFRINYRLGDTLRFCQAASKVDRIPNTLQADYHKAACPESHPSFVPGGNLTVIQSLLDARDGLAGFGRPPPDALVIHMRIGDVIEGFHSASELLKEGGKAVAHSGFFRSIHQYVKEIQWKNKPSSALKIFLVGGVHNHDPSPKSRAYTGCLYRALVLLGYNVTLRTDGYEADEDFYFVSHAPKVMLATGGFSYLLGHMVHQYGGQIEGTNIWDNNWNQDEPWELNPSHSLPHTLPPKRQ